MGSPNNYDVVPLATRELELLELRRAGILTARETADLDASPPKNALPGLALVVLCCS